MAFVQGGLSVKNRIWLLVGTWLLAFSWMAAAESNRVKNASVDQTKERRAAIVDKVSWLGGSTSVGVDQGGPEETYEDGLEPEDIRRSIREILPQIKSCYEKRLVLAPKLKGKVVLKLLLENNGRVSRANMKMSELKDSQVEDCLIRVFQNKQFTPHKRESPGSFEYPIQFFSVEPSK